MTDTIQTGSYSTKQISLTVDLPALAGSDKQVSWATDLRRRTIQAALVKLVDCPAAVAKWDATPAGRRDALLTALGTVAAEQTSAKWWIDHRSMGHMDLLRAAASRVLAE